MSQKNIPVIPLTLIVALILLVATWSVFHKRELHIYPAMQGSEYSLYNYNDAADSGKSIVNSAIKNGQIIFNYELKSGATYPYVGMGLIVGKKDSTGKSVEFLNLEGYDSLYIRLRSAKSEELRIQIITHDPTFTRQNDPMTNRFLVQSFLAERTWTTKALLLSDFAIPEWWFTYNNLRADPANRQLKHTVAIEFQNGARMPVNVADTVEIESISFVGERRYLSWSLMGIALLLISAFGVLSWLERERLRTEKALHIAQRLNSALDSADKIPLNSHRTEDSKRILEYIGKNYQNSELDLETVCKETGINRNRLSVILKDEVGGTFKTYLTELRLNEATRALTQTDLQVTEIAYTVGFGNVSHFNRVFKEKFSIAPNEYRKTQQNLSKAKES